MSGERFAVAAGRFAEFFRELDGAFAERSDVVCQLGLALLAREHVLVTGPPGTAKSQLASAVLGRVLGEQTRRPSLYARQFTESTVQTDLVGPIDFKTLMETGRTEHFTDEGMLGAVHAFLDEVFDGRDMLLRTTLNVLHERELKQGTKTSAGRIECAVMTTNRYLAEVLETQRETLLAFVDRIAFVGFVPRGFADPSHLPRVLRHQLAGGFAKLRGVLTIEDLDVLQDAADAVVVPDALADRLATLLALLDDELAAAARADASFLPTRYLSTRTAVRSARILRAICLWDRLMHAPERALVVRPDDFALLRLHLTLAGPNAVDAAKLAARESDPRERRQLAIVRTERDAFDRCLKRLPPPPPEPVVVPVDVAALQRKVESAQSATAGPASFVEAARELAEAAASARPGAQAAAAALEQVIAATCTRVLKAGLLPGAERDGDPVETASRLASLADELEHPPVSSRRHAVWLRGRARALLEELVAVGGVAEPTTAAAPSPRNAAARIARIEAIAGLRARLIAAGAGEPDAPGPDWNALVDRLEDELVPLADEPFREATANALRSSSGGGGDLAELLPSMAAALGEVAALGARLQALRDPATPAAPPTSSKLEREVVGRRLSPIVAAFFARLDVADRRSLTDRIVELLTLLEKAGVARSVSAKEVLGWVAGALVRAEEKREPPARAPSGLGGYRALRSAEERIPVLYLLVELSLRVEPRLAAPADAPDAWVASAASLIGSLPRELCDRIGTLDLRRVDRALTYLEGWWREVETELSVPGLDAKTRLDRLAQSDIQRVLGDEQGLTRFALELRLVRELLPEHAPVAERLRGRAHALHAATRSVRVQLLGARSDAAWAELLH